MTDRNLRSTTPRGAAALAYLPPIGLILLALPRWRSIRMVRDHSIAASVLLGATALGMPALSALAAGVGSLEAQIVVGVVFAVWLIVFAALSGWLAWEAWQGNPPPWPGVGPEKRPPPRRRKRTTK